MVLTDILNKGATELVEKTGVSKYTYAQLCNFLATAPAAWCVMDGYQNGSTASMFAGSAFALYNMTYILYNQIRRASESPGYVERTVKEQNKAGRNVTRQDIESKLANAELFEDKMQSSGLFQVLTGIGFATIVGLVYHYAGEELGENLSQLVANVGALSLSSLLGGMSNFFRAANTSSKR